MSQEYHVIHRPKINKFLVRLVPGKYAYLGYKVEGGKFYIETTYTPEEYRGRGIAAYLTRVAIEWAREKGLKVVPVCSYAVYFFKKNKDLWDVLAPEGLEAVKET